MIREQGLEPTPVRRWLLECGLSNAWEIYLCLLLAEVESYRAMADTFSLSPLVELIDRNATALQALRTLRDKLLHPTKDVPYEQTLLDYFREVESHYPIHFLFAKHLQTLLDQYLRELKDHLINTLAGDMAHLSDNQLHAFFKREEYDLKHALSRADNTTDKTTIAKFVRENNDLARRMQLDPVRRNDPLDKEQRKQLRNLHDFKMTLHRATPMPTTDYHSPTAVQLPMHPNLSSYIPIPPAPDTEGFYRGSLLPPPLQRAQSDHATLVFRATLLLSESLHHTDAMLQRNFPGMSHSQIQELDDWMTRVPIPTAHEDIAAAQRGSSPGM